MNTGDKIAIGILLTVLCAAFVVYALMAGDFKQACKAHGGEPVHNGRNWECIK